MSCRRTRKCLNVQVHFDSQAMRESEETSSSLDLVLDTPSLVMLILFCNGFRYLMYRSVGNKTSQALSLVRPFTILNTETENSRCPQTDATKQVKDNIK